MSIVWDLPSYYSWRKYSGKRVNGNVTNKDNVGFSYSVEGVDVVDG